MPIIEQYISRVQPPQGRETVPSNMAGIAAAPAEAVSRLGGAMTDFGSQVLNQISQAKDAMELATLRGNLGDRKNALFNTLATTPDEAVREQLYNQAKQQTDTLTSKRPNVQRVFDAEKKLALVDWQADFNTVNNRLLVQNIQDEFRLNHNRLLEQGKLQEDLQLLNTARATMAISSAEYDHYKANAPNESILLQMDKAAQEGNFGTVSTRAEQLKNPSADQLKRKNTILKAVEQMQGDAGDAFQKAILKEAIDADAGKMDALSRTNLAADMKRRIAMPDNGLTGEQTRVLMSWVDNWSAPGDIETDWPSYQRVRQLVGPVARGEMKLNDAFTTYYKEFVNLGRQERKELLEKLISASEEKTKEPETNPFFARGMATLGKGLTDGLFNFSDKSLKDKLSPDEYDKFIALDKNGKDTARVQYANQFLYEAQNDLEKWYNEHPDATADDLEAQTEKYLELPKKEAAKEWLGARAWNWLGENPPSVLLGLRKPSWAEPQVGPLRIYLRTAINPKTGERMGTYDGTKWEKIP